MLNVFIGVSREPLLLLIGRIVYSIVVRMTPANMTPSKEFRNVGTKIL
jgi:hypothetical protein